MTKSQTLSTQILAGALPLTPAVKRSSLRRALKSSSLGECGIENNGVLLWSAPEWIQNAKIEIVVSQS